MMKLKIYQNFTKKIKNKKLKKLKLKLKFQ